MRSILAALLPFFAFIIQWTFWAMFQPFVWFLFYPTVFISSWIGGFYGGIAATVISITLVWQFFMPDGDPNILSVIVFFGMGVLFSRLHESLKRANTEVANAILVLRRSADEIQDIYNNAPCGYHSLDKEGYFIRINDTELSWLGYTREELVGKMKATDIITPASIDKFKANYPLFIKTGSISELDFEFIRKDGTVFPVLLTASAVYDEKGDYIMSRTTLFDVKLHKRMEAELRRSKMLLEKIFASLKEVVLIVDPHTRTILSVNPAVRHIFGYEIDEVVGRNTGFLHVNSETYEEFGRRLFTALNKDGVYHDNFMMRCKDGRIIDTEHSVTEILDETGKHAAVVSVIRDVTERKRSEQEYKTIIQGALDGFVMLDSRGRFLDVNDTYSHLIGYSRDELLKMSISDVEAMENQEDTARRIQKVMRTGSDRFETRHRRKDGMLVDIDVSANYVDIGGGRFYSFYRDITEHKKAENELRRSGEQLRSLAYSLQSAREGERKRIARDIHDELGQTLTALNIKLSCIEEMLDLDQKPILDQTREALSLVESTIDTVQRISSDLRPTILDDLGIVAAIESHANQFQDKSGIKCLMTFHPDKIVLEKSLAAELFRICQEALTNVWRHAKATRVDISLRKADDKLVLQIFDNGKGISKEEITDPCSVGLTGMRERVYPWYGNVQIVGVPNKGTTVTVVVPAGNKRRNM